MIVRTSLARLEQLDIGDQALTFGRIDRVRDGADQSHAVGPDGDRSDTETFHIGRLAIHGADHEPLVVDWRAPVAEPFYRATGATPWAWSSAATWPSRAGGWWGSRTSASWRRDRWSTPTIRRAGRWIGRPSGSGELIVGDLPIGGPAALLAALERARSGRMTDIVATIQREQDEIIRAPLTGVLVVQGGPGHRQDGGGAAPGRLPPLHPPVPPGAPGRAGGRAQPPVPPLHRAGAALAGGDRRHPVDRLGTGARDPGPRRRTGRRGPLEG